MALTKRQQEVFEYIKEFSKRKGYSPSLEDIKEHFQLSAKSGVHDHVKALQEKGYITRSKNKARSIEVAKSKNVPSPLVRIPLLGTIAAGEPIEAMENKEYVAVPKDKLPSSREVYALRVAGSSMVDENINDGDVVLVKQQAVAENGQKVVALLNNQEATLKTFYKERGQIRLQPANKEYGALIIKDGEREVAVQGTVIDIIRGETPAPMVLPEVKVETKRYRKLPLNKIICGDAVDVMQTFPQNSIDLVVTSPPYDAVRDYKGFSLNLHAAGGELYRTLKDGGIVAMVIQDQTKNFGKSLTSFRTIIDWCDSFGFKLFETVIYRKYGAEGAWWNKRFRVDHEYIPIFLKGKSPQYFDKTRLKIPSKHDGKTLTGGGTRLTNGIRIATRPITINPFKCRGTIWEYLTAGDGSRLKHKHPATFPNQLPYDFIQCFCPKEGVVLDPFVGSGTTTVAAKNLGHQYIGIDVAPEYCALAEKRMVEECIPSQSKLI